MNQNPEHNGGYGPSPFAAAQTQQQDMQNAQQHDPYANGRGDSLSSAAPIHYDPYSNGDLAKWYGMQEQLSKLRVDEMDLRKKIIAAVFPTVKEGVNNLDLPDGAVLKATGSTTRKVVEEVFLALRDEMAAQHSLPLDKLVRWKPEVVVAEYKKLDDESRAVFDQVLDIKPGTPSLEVAIPKRRR